MLSFQTVEPDTLELLRRLQQLPELKGMRLVGGTSLALQYGHRQSVGLDLFGTLASSLDDVEAALAGMGQHRVLNRTANMLQSMLNDIKADIVNYSCYEWIDAPVVEGGIVLASPKDIAALKVNAIEGRGSKKDFIDIYVLLQHHTLGDLLSFYVQKYPNHSQFRALLSLTYFEDADMQAMPKMFIPVDWEEVKSSIVELVGKYQ